MVIWGGVYSYFTFLKDGGLYDPLTDTWDSSSTTNAPVARANHTAVWTGSKMIVWGGQGSNGGGFIYFNDGGIYDPTANTWNAISSTNAPSARDGHVAVWTGSKMIVWGGAINGGTATNTGGIYDPVNNIWTATSLENAPHGRVAHTAVWTGSKMIVWGGDSVGYMGVLYYFNTGGIYDPVTDTWTSTTTVNAPSPRTGHTAVWTGSKMVVWGGDYQLNSGGVYDPLANSWTQTSTNNVPSGRDLHTAIWTGNKMIIWGGDSAADSPTNTGGIYDLSTNTWTATSTGYSVPNRRDSHTSVWATNKMIIWGGWGYGGLNSGAIYFNPAVIEIKRISSLAPSAFFLFQNYPNPFNPVTKIKFEVPKSAFTKIIVYDILGREVATLVNEYLKPGTYEYEWDGNNLASGVYFYKLIAGDYQQCKKMVLVK